MLGYIFDRKGPSQSNWFNAEEKLREKVINYSTLKCPITAQANIIRSLLISFLMYTASVLDIPSGVKTKLEKIIFRFLWQGGPDKVKRIIVKLPRFQGGLGVPDLNVMALALHTKWTQIALDSDIRLTKMLTSFFSVRKLLCSLVPHCRILLPAQNFPYPFIKKPQVRYAH